MLDDLTSYTRKQLLEMARNAGFDGISRHTKAQLIELLAEGEGDQHHPARESGDNALVHLTKKELQKRAKKEGHTGYSRMTKAELIDLLAENESAIGTLGGSEELTRERGIEPAAGTSIPRPEETGEGGYEGKWAHAAPSGPIPERYDKTHVVLMVRDPAWLHAYWEIQEDTQEAAKQNCQGEARFVIRCHDVSEGEQSSHFDVDVTGGAQNWYLNSNKPGGSFYVQIGLLDDSGQFHVLAESDPVTAPPNEPSVEEDQQWMSLEGGFEQIYSLSGGRNLGLGSLELRELIERRYQEEMASGGISSWGSGGYAPQQGRGFWMVLNTELVVYGATDPDATVTVDGRPIELRPDGTFTLRYALPDGERVIPVEATSPDGVEVRTITPQVSKSTTHKETEKVGS